MIDLVRLNLEKDLDHAPEIVESNGFQTHMVPDSELLQIDKRADLNVARRTTDGVSLFQKQFREISAVLTRDPGNDRLLHGSNGGLVVIPFGS